MTEKQDQDTYKILSRYSDQKPMAAERCYPVSAVTEMMIEYAEQVKNFGVIGDVIETSHQNERFKNARKCEFSGEGDLCSIPGECPYQNNDGVMC